MDKFVLINQTRICIDDETERAIARAKIAAGSRDFQTALCAVWSSARLHKGPEHTITSMRFDRIEVIAMREEAARLLVDEAAIAARVTAERWSDPALAGLEVLYEVV